VARFVGVQKHPDTTSIVQRMKRQSSLPSAFARIDALAVSSLSGESLARYYAYKQTLLDLEQDDESVISTLSIYVWDLFEDRSVRELH
jgi:hypothetical protein